MEYGSELVSSGDDDNDSTASRRCTSGDSSQDGGSMDVDSEQEHVQAIDDEALEVEDVKGTKCQGFRLMNGVMLRREDVVGQVSSRTWPGLGVAMTMGRGKGMGMGMGSGRPCYPIV